ncbi:uncharacterized protein LOC125449534 [Stegostoma tigrinum]|uniref:uncharacterized protein LOC125449534 n=1 Tax=Stegostoma tigrinum TaxID=3053191 RepID=UPI0028707BC4|nr:uncharacterized protein LOC125449534 [Stegostoma tigrinum]
MHRPIQHVEKAFYSVLAFVRIPVNLLAIVILSHGKCGVSPCTTRYLVLMTAADLMVIITDVILWRFPSYYLPPSFLIITPVCSVTGILHRTARDCSVWFTVTFTFDRFVTICCQKLKTKYCTEKTASVVLATTCTLFCLKSIPFYFQYEPLRIINNVPFYCKSKSSYFTDIWWVALECLDTILTPFLPFVLILSLNAIIGRHIFVTSQVRKRLQCERKRGKHKDAEMESRRKSVILLFVISGSFILLWSILVVYFMYYVIQEIKPDDFSPFLYNFGSTGYMLQFLNCCTNTVIYATTLSRFRAKISNANAAHWWLRHATAQAVVGFKNPQGFSQRKRSLELNEYCRPKISNWPTKSRTRVVVDGNYSAWNLVTSAVLHGPVLGLPLFVKFINDLAEEVEVWGRTFADDMKHRKFLLSLVERDAVFVSTSPEIPHPREKTSAPVDKCPNSRVILELRPCIPAQCSLSPLQKKAPGSFRCQRLLNDSIHTALWLALNCPQKRRPGMGSILVQTTVQEGIPEQNQAHLKMKIQPGEATKQDDLHAKPPEVID